MAYQYRTTIHMADTDATGALYFANQFRLALEAFECFLSDNGFVLGPCLLPIVHAEADFTAPLKLWDVVDISLHCSKIGTSSFTIESAISGYGRVQIVHVHTDGAGVKQPVSSALRSLLLKLRPADQACPGNLVGQSSELDA